MTIVVLLILAGITISLVFGENGVIAKAREAANKTNEAAINEQEELNKADDYIEDMVNSGGSTPEEPDDPTKDWDLSKVDPIESEDEIIVPVPKGYVASKVTEGMKETTVKDGFVIYEGTEEVNNTNKDTAWTTRNQFVWVPVENPSEMYGTDSSGKRWGKLYYFDASGITARDWKEENGVMTTPSTYECHEPDEITGDNEIDKEQLETDFANMIASVETYGGFYIGRYETGNLSQEEAVVIKNNSDINNQTWDSIYNKAKGIAANNNVTTSMTWGCQWDAVMRWMYNSEDETKRKYTYDSTGKGNYRDTNVNEPIATGSNDIYAVNNIYDMAGNVEEWTTEIFGKERGSRGGNYYTAGYIAIGGNGVPSGGYRFSIDGEEKSIGSRTVLNISI